MFCETFIFQLLVVILPVKLVKSSIDGLSYMDPNNKKVPGLYPRGQDPCNPLYWYPRNIPEYCAYRNFPIPERFAPVPPQPMPAPTPQPNIIMSFPNLSAGLPVLAPIPYGIPNILSHPMLSVAPLMPSYPYSSNPYANQQQAGMVPGLPGLVTKDGGINILPFSDAYSDLIENHKNRMIRRKLEKLIQEYEDFPNGKSYRRLRKYASRNT